MRLAKFTYAIFFYCFTNIQIEEMQLCEAIKDERKRRYNNMSNFSFYALSSQMKNKGLIKNLNGTAQENHFNANFDLEV